MLWYSLCVNLPYAFDQYSRLHYLDSLWRQLTGCNKILIDFGMIFYSQ